MTGGDHQEVREAGGKSGGDWRGARWWDRPWARNGGMPDEVLVTCVARGDLEPLRNLWKHSQITGAVAAQPSQDDTFRFLAAAHHCATAAGLQNRMAALSARVRRDPIDLTNVRQASDQWAEAVVRQSKRQPVAC